MSSSVGAADDELNSSDFGAFDRLCETANEAFAVARRRVAAYQLVLGRFARLMVLINEADLQIGRWNGINFLTCRTRH